MKYQQYIRRCIFINTFTTKKNKGIVTPNKIRKKINWPKD